MNPLVASGTNYWGRKIIDPLTIVRKHLEPLRDGSSSSLATAINLGLDGLLNAVGAPKNRCKHVKELVLNPPERVETTSDYEVFAHDELKKVVDEASWRKALRSRTHTIVEQVRRYIPKGARLVDVGCGDGMVGWALREHCDHIELCDVVDYVHHDIKHTVTFTLFADGDPLPIDGTFDEALLITVLHHTQDPSKLLKALKGHVKELIIIESVYFDEERRFFDRCDALKKDEQFIFASYFDWFYNRVINRGVPVTFNYGTPREWEQLLSDNGYEVTMNDEESFGVDIPLVPEFHLLIKASRRQGSIQ